MRLFLTVFLLGFISIFISSCGNTESTADICANKKILLISNAADPSVLDPNLATGLNEYKILTALFEGLVSADSKNLKIIPAAAESWEIEGLKYTFHIRKDAKWSDGKDLLASDFVFAFKRILNPKLGAEYAYFLYPLKNAKALNNSELKDFNLLGAKAIDDKTLVLELERPCAYFLDLLYHSAFFPLPEHVLKNLNAVNTRNMIWTKPSHMVSNGPFKLSLWKINDKVSVSKNPMYWDKNNVKLNRIMFFPIANVNTEDRAFRADQIHITDSVTPYRIDSIKKDMPENFKNSDWLGTYYYMINTSKKPLDDARVRKALSISICRQSIIDNFLKCGQKPATAFIPSIADEFSSLAFVKEDIEEAKKLLSEAGYPDGKNFPKLKIVYNTSEQHKPIAEAIQAMWKKNLGIEIELYNLSWPAYLQARRLGDFDITRASWVADFKSPDSFLSLFESTSLINHSRWSSKKFDEFLNDARTANEKESFLKYAKAEKILLDESVVIPIYFYARTYLINKRVKNWHNNILDYRNFKEVDFHD